MGITNAGMAEAAGLLGATGSPTEFTYIAYGDSTTAFAAAQTALVGTESQRAAATVSRVTTAVTNDTLQLTKTFTISATETIGESGVLNAGAAGDMLARQVLSPTRNVVSGDSWVATWKFQIADGA